MSTESELRDEICYVGHMLAAKGLTPGASGNISVQLVDGWLMTPTGSSLGSLDPNRLSRLNAAGRHVAGDRPTKEALLHRAIYAARPNDRAVVHLHSTYAVAVACLCHPNPDNVLPAYTPYYQMRVGRLPLVPYFMPGDAQLAEAVAQYAVGSRAVLLANHGPVVSGPTLASAVASIEELEETAKLHLLLAGRQVQPLSAYQIADLEAAFPS